MSGIAALMAGMQNMAGSERGVPVPSLRMSLTLAHQSKIRSMYCSRQSLASQENSSPASEMGAPSSMTQAGGGNNPSSRPDSSSSTTSSVADWESGLSTVRRQPPTTTSLGKLALSGSRQVEEVSAFTSLLSGANTATLTDARSRPRFKSPGGAFAPPKKRAVHHSVDEDSSSKAGRSGSLDTLDRLSVRSELTKAPTGAQTSHVLQQQRRRHRSVERTLDDDADSACDANDESASVQFNERFSAAVFQHAKPTKFVAAKTAPAIPSRPAVKNSRSHQAMSHRPLDAAQSDHEPDLSAAIYSLRSGEAEMSAGVQLSHNTGSRSIQDHIIATQMSRLNREMPISDVYHERNMGLGLAPPLSELLVNSVNSAGAGGVSASAAGGSASVTSSEDVFSSFDQISLADTVTDLSDKPTSYAKRPPPRPKMPGSTWSSGAFHATGSRQHRMSVFDASSPETDISSANATMTLRHGILDMTRRDEADGRSMTDSNYSGYSPHRNLKIATMMPAKHAAGPARDDGHAKETNKSNTIHAVAIIESDGRANEAS